MKFNWRWLWQESFLLFFGIVCTVLLCTLHMFELPDIGFPYIMLSVIALGCFACIFATLSTGETYYKYYMIDKEAFQSYVFENMLVLSHKDVAWTFTSNIDEIHALKEIKAIEYFNIKKKQVKWRLIPYQQLDEIRAAKLTAKRAAKKARKKNEIPM